MTDYVYIRRARSRRALVVLAAVYAVLLFGMVAIDLVWWIAAFVSLFTLPALYEFLTDKRAELALSDSALRWSSGSLARTVPLAEIQRARFDTRWDLSVRVTLILRDGEKLRLPPQCTPPHRGFEAALKALGLPVERHHFVVF